MTKVILYRLEKMADGYGPYAGRDDGPEDDVLIKHYTSGKSPEPQEEGLSITRSVHLCAFASLPKLFAWFSPKELSALRRLGYRIRQWEVEQDRVQYGKKQCVFETAYGRRLAK